MQPIPCKTCSVGQVSPTRIYRMSGPVVVIGWLFLIPSFLGIAFAVLMAVGSVGSGAAMIAMKPPPEVVNDIRAAGAPADLVVKIEQGKPLTMAEENQLPQRARERYANFAGAKAAGAAVGATMGVGFAGFMGCASFTGGLLGWLLTMKRSVLMCGSCQAVVDRA